MDEPRSTIGLELLAKRRHEHLEAVGAKVFVITPNMQLYVVSVEDAIGVFEKIGQQLELDAGHLYLTFAARYSTCPEVDHQVIEGKRAVITAAIAFEIKGPKERTDPSEEFVEGEGLGEVIVGPCIQTGYPVSNIVACRQHQDGPSKSRAPKTSTRLQAIDTRKVEIEDHQLGIEVALRIQGKLAAVDPAHVIGLHLQDDREGFSNPLVVLHHENLRLVVLS